MVKLETLGPDCSVDDIVVAIDRDGACIVLRQEENQYLSCPPGVAKDLAPELTDLLGYTMGNFSLGFCTSPVGEHAGASMAPESVLGRYPTAYSTA
jgi:hypothetical protein